MVITACSIRQISDLNRGCDDRNVWIGSMNGVVKVREPVVGVRRIASVQVVFISNLDGCQFERTETRIVVAVLFTST